MDIKEAVDHLRAVMARDADYAWSWHRNIAMAYYDIGGDHEIANKGAARFMQMLFGVDMTTHPAYQDIMAQYEKVVE